MKGIIIGGGIGGLTLGVALYQVGIKATVYEAAEEIKPVGAGIILGTNAMIVMKALGLDEKIRSAGQSIKNGAITDENMRILQNMPFEQIEKHFGIGTVAIHRAKLQAILIDALPKEQFIINKRCVSIIEGEQPKATFQDASTASGDFLIGADGIHSVVRQHIFPTVPKRYSGQTCWRGILNYELPYEDKGTVREIWSKEGRFAAIQISDDLVYWYAVQKANAGEKDNPETLHQDLIGAFKSFEHAESIISKTSKHQIIRGDLWDLKPTSKWHKGNIALLGDAIHATTPNLGQGGAQAIEDGLALARCFEKEKGIAVIFKKYEKIRYPKAKMVTDQSWLFGKMAHWENPLAIGLRNFMMRTTPSQLFIKRFLKLYEVNY